jgi:general secretion pathway protein E
VPGVGVTLDDETLQQARRLALAAKRSLVTELEALTGSEPRQIVEQLAQRFRLGVMDTTEMLACTPAFELLPLARAQTRGLRSPAPPPARQ